MELIDSIREELKTVTSAAIVEQVHGVCTGYDCYPMAAIVSRVAQLTGQEKLELLPHVENRRNEIAKQSNKAYNIRRIVS